MILTTKYVISVPITYNFNGIYCYNFFYPVPHLTLFNPSCMCHCILFKCKYDRWIMLTPWIVPSDQTSIWHWSNHWPLILLPLDHLLRIHPSSTFTSTYSLYFPKHKLPFYALLLLSKIPHFPNFILVMKWNPIYTS